MEHKNSQIHSEYTASSKDDLLIYLRQQDISVPPRTEGRTKQHCERAIGFRLLATWAIADRFSYPLRLVHQDKPDFFLFYDGREVGIEYTEAVQEEWAATTALAKKMGKKVTMSLDQFNRGMRKRTGKERRKLIEEEPLPGDGFVDDEPERNWALIIKDYVLAKTKAFNQSDFKKYATNRLLIYDNLGIADLDIGTSMKFLKVYMNCYWLQESRYDGLLIDMKKQLLEVDHTGNWNQQPIVNLWPNQMK